MLRVYLQSLSYSYGHEIVPPFLSAAAASYSRHSHPHLYLERTHTLTHLQPQQRSSRHWNQVPLITIIICVTITRPTHLYSLLFTVFASTFPLISLLLSLSLLSPCHYEQQIPRYIVAALLSFCGIMKMLMIM